LRLPIILLALFMPVAAWAIGGERASWTGAYVAPSASASTGVLSSFYGAGERLAKRTASGEIFRPLGLTAAHRTLPLGTRLRVCFTSCADVTVNDRGPAAWTGRELDLSLGAARAVGLTGVGVGRVTIATLD